MPTAAGSQYSHFLIDGVPYVGTYGLLNDEEWATGEVHKPDPSWSCVDASKHLHAVDTFSGTYPTLITRTVPMPCNGGCGDSEDCDGYSETQYFCRICDERIKPRFVKTVEQQLVGRTYAWKARVQGATPPKHGSLVSVLITSDAQAPRFGVAHVLSWTYDSDGVEVELDGIGRLGWRPDEKRKGS